ncbi:MAG: 16S rRNA (guanine(527)-N(7))-methyltransferase RsmG [Candidatus Promineifilaceae bacterium]
MPSIALLQTEAERLGIALTAEQLTQFEQYQALLLSWNQKINLTAITAPVDILIRHFLDSLSCTVVTGDLTGQSLVDVGTGAGFPGLPLKILYPGMALTLVESVGKKADFLGAVSAELALKDVKIITDRAEAVGQNLLYRGQFDWAAARAVAGMPVLAEYLLPLCKVGGHMLAQKGESAAEEVEQADKAIALLGGGNLTLTEIDLPGVESKHYLVVVEKIRPTPEKYPRRVGVPGKRPIE